MKDDEMVVSLKSSKPAAPVVSPEPQPAPRRPRRGWVYVGYAAITALTFAALAFGWNFISTRNNSTDTPTAPAATTAQPATSAPAQSPQASSTVAQVVAEVGALIELPQNETPTVATVTDPSKLQGQAFFAKAKTGDVVLLYTQAGEAYLYDPTEGKLVDVAPISTSTPQ